MATPITSVATWTDTIPTPDNGDGGTGAGLDAMTQSLANREEYLKSQVDSVGVRRIRSAIDTTALAALAVTGTGDVCVVQGIGVYRYDALGADPAVDPWIVNSASGGQWFHELAAIRESYLATVAPGGKVVQPVPNRIVTTKSTELTGVGNLFFTTAGTWTDATGANSSVTDVAANDVVIATLRCRAILGSAPTAANTCKIRLAYELLGVTTSIAEFNLQELTAPNDVAPVIPWMTRKAFTGPVTWAAGDPHIFKVQLISDTTTQARLLYPFSLTLEHIRP